jgi:hypothetical protein
MGLAESMSVVHHSTLKYDWSTSISYNVKMGLNDAATFLQPLRYELNLIKCIYDKKR